MCHSDSYSDIGCAAVLHKEGCRFLIGIGYETFPEDRCGDNPQGPGKYLDVREQNIMKWIKNEIKSTYCYLGFVATHIMPSHESYVIFMTFRNLQTNINKR